MSVLTASPARPKPLPPLENGLHLGASEFLRRYDNMPDLKKAELINGIVYMGSPVRTDEHGIPDSLIQGLLFTYSASTPGVLHAINSTIRLGSDDVPQPDGFMWIAKDSGRPTLDEKGYLEGAPELVVEIAASSASIDARVKFNSYRRAGAKEYLLWRTEDESVDWWYLTEEQYVSLPQSEDGILRSRVFPGLWLNVPALLSRNGSGVLATLQQGLASSDYLQFRQSLPQ